MEAQKRAAFIKRWRAPPTRVNVIEMQKFYLFI